MPLSLAENSFGSPTLTYADNDIRLSNPWQVVRQTSCQCGSFGSAACFLCVCAHGTPFVLCVRACCYLGAELCMTV